jgi:uncharacterized protein (TIGR00661 family)
MRILYGIQGTGHGHISRAREIVPLLARDAEIDVLISGYNCKMNLDDVTVIRKRGLSLEYDSKGSVSYLQTALNIRPVTFIQDVHSINPNAYDLVISDYEPVTAWASLNTDVPSIALSHQASFLSSKSPRPVKRSLMAEQLLRYFAPCKKPIGFHFRRYDSFILPPVIRSDVRNLETCTGDHITVYLPAFNYHSLIPLFRQCTEVNWHLFSPDCNSEIRERNVTVYPVGNRPFLESMKSSIGVITSAGFETCAEAMYLNKKLLVIPIQNQYEQLCNAASLSETGVLVAHHIDDSSPSLIRNWIQNAPVIPLQESADMQQLCNKLLRFTSSRASLSTAS